jgi:ABC-type transporter Mla subunit MlaD
MSAGEVAAVVASVAVGIGVVGLLLTLGAVIRTLTVMRRAVEDFRRQAVPLLADVHTAVRQANSELGKVDGILDRADSISGTVDSASRLAYRAFSAPVVKGMAFASGTAKAFRALRKRG